MNPLDQLLQMLFGQAQPRRDLGQQQPVATFAGRVVQPGDTTATAMQRMPMGSGEGDLQTALTASLGAAAQPAMAAGSKMLAAKLLATMVPARPVFHGTPSSVAGNLPTEQMGQKFGEMVGSTGHYVSESPQAASAYSGGSISEANHLLNKADYGPTVRPYMMKEHQALGTNVPVTAQELQGVLDAINKTYNPAPKQTKYGTTSTEQQRSNLLNAVQNGMLPEVSPGEHLRGILSGMLGQQAGEDMLKAGGFKSIYYPGEHSSTMGMENAQAYKVLDNSILQNLFEARAQQQAIANATSRSRGAVGANAVVPKYIEANARPGEAILDFGAGKDAAHAQALKGKGFNVIAHDFGQNVVPGLHDPNALSRQYDRVYASNVLNTQSSPEMLVNTLQQILQAVKPEGSFVGNLPASPRKFPGLDANLLVQELQKLFGNVERVSGTPAAPVLQAKQPRK